MTLAAHDRAQGVAADATDHLGTVGKSSAGSDNQEVARGRARLSTSRKIRRLSGRILYDRERDNAAQHATCWCGRFMHAGSGSLYRTIDGASARMSGIGTCGNLWTCAVCALALSERRRAELLAGMAHWHKQGGRVYLLTLTLSHHATDPLAKTERALARALVMFKAGKAWRELSAQVERAGSVRSIEVTYSDANGWHPHSHELVFCKREPAPRLLDAARAAWVAALERADVRGSSLSDALAHAFDWRGGDKAGEYVAKYGRDVDGWSAADELTRSHAKIGTRGAFDHVTPFELVLWWGEGDAHAGTLFREYAAAFKGRRALYWSPGLKSKLGIADLSDDEIRAELGRDAPLPEEERIAGITPQQWSLIVSREAEGELYELACALTDVPGSDRQDAIDDFIGSLKLRPPENTGRITYRQWRSGKASSTDALS